MNNINPFVKIGDIYKVVNNCFCEEYLHEIVQYNRSGLVEKKLIQGEIVILNGEFVNFYGRFLIVLKDGIEFYIKPSNLERK